MLSVVVQLSVKNFAKGHLQKHEDTRAKHRQRNRAEENDQRIAEAVKLRGQDKENQHNREQENAEEFAAFHPQLAGAAGVIDDITRRAGSGALRFREISSVASTEPVGTPLMVTALSCCMRLSERATVLCLIWATVLSGISWLLAR